MTEQQTAPALTCNHGLTHSLRGTPYLPAIMSLRGCVVITCGPGQWDALLASGYDIGALLVEVGDDGRVRRVYEKPSV